MRKIAILLFPILLFFSSCEESKLPYYGHHDIDPDTMEKVFHQIPEFSFVNQSNEIVTEKYLDNKITIVDFFFTTCPSICPDMTNNMKELQGSLKEYKNIQFLSHTVNPEVDTVEKLQKYIKKFELNTSNWNFVTGSKSEIYDLGVNYYLLNAQEDVLAPGGFLHSEFFVLIDQNRNHRGVYDGTDAEEMEKLKKDLKTLQNERK